MPLPSRRESETQSSQGKSSKIWMPTSARSQRTKRNQRSRQELISWISRKTQVAVRLSLLPLLRVQLQARLWATCSISTSPSAPPLKSQPTPRKRRRSRTSHWTPFCSSSPLLRCLRSRIAKTKSESSCETQLRSTRPLCS